MEKKGNYFNFFYIDSYEDNIPILENMEEIYDLVNKKVIFGIYEFICHLQE